MHPPSAVALAALALAACEPGAPAEPSWQVDVMPILAATCIRCHGAPVIGGSPVDLRLDSFDNTVVDNRGTVDEPADDLIVYGAATWADHIPGEVSGDEPKMPPLFPLDPWQVETLSTFFSARPVVRGAPRPGNRPPSFALRESARDGAVVTLAYELHDPDGDLVVGELCDDDGPVCSFVAPVQSGRGEVRIDPAILHLPVELRVRLDDGAGMVESAAPAVELP